MDLRDSRDRRGRAVEAVAGGHRVAARRAQCRGEQVRLGRVVGGKAIEQARAAGGANALRQGRDRAGFAIAQRVGPALGAEAMAGVERLERGHRLPANRPGAVGPAIERLVGEQRDLPVGGRGHVHRDHVGAQLGRARDRTRGVRDVIVRRLLDPRAGARRVVVVTRRRQLAQAAIGDQLDRPFRLGREPAGVDHGKREEPQREGKGEIAQPGHQPSSSRARAQSRSICAISPSIVSNFASGRRKWWKATSISCP